MLKTALGQEGIPTSEQISEIVKNAEAYAQAEKQGTNPATLQKTNSDLKGQVQFLQNRLNKGKGGDLPPCWANEAGKAEMFLTVYLKEDSVSFEPAWPTTRKADAEALPNFSALMANTLGHMRIFFRQLARSLIWPISESVNFMCDCRVKFRARCCLIDAV